MYWLCASVRIASKRISHAGGSFYPKAYNTPPKFGGFQRKALLYCRQNVRLFGDSLEQYRVLLQILAFACASVRYQPGEKIEYACSKNS
jgi:hypothetical protein